MNVSEALQKSDGWDELMNATGRDDFGNLRLSIFKEDVLHANVTKIGAVMAMRLANGSSSHCLFISIKINLSNQPVAVAFR